MYKDINIYICIYIYQYSINCTKSSEIIPLLYLELLTPKKTASSILQYLKCSCGYNKSSAFQYAVRRVERQTLSCKDDGALEQITLEREAEQSWKTFAH